VSVDNDDDDDDVRGENEDEDIIVGVIILVIDWLISLSVWFAYVLCIIVSIYTSKLVESTIIELFCFGVS